MLAFLGQCSSFAQQNNHLNILVLQTVELNLVAANLLQEEMTFVNPRALFVWNSICMKSKTFSLCAYHSETVQEC